MAQEDILNQMQETTNLVDAYDDSTLDEMGMKLVEDFDEDLESRSDWEEQNDEWMKLASQLVETKTYPWENAANVKYPLLSTAALQFHARAYPALVSDGNLVKVKKFGRDIDGSKTKKANRISEYMSYQLLEEMPEWQEDMDRLLYLVPILGLAYKKTFYSVSKGRNVSELVLPRDLVINYHADDFERATKTHRFWMDQNELLEYQRGGIFRDIDISDPAYREHDGIGDDILKINPSDRADALPYEILECHTWWDLDNDGYKEPYTITVDHDSKKVLRIVARYASDGVKTHPVTGEIIKIDPIEHFTMFPFLPNPESKIYTLGFGSLLGPLNKAVNTITNQLIDAGTLANLQGGFLGKGVRVRGGVIKFKPGLWQQVQSTGDDLRKGIFPLPVKEPSNVLFQLLGMLIQSGERLASVKDIMVGENPGQNQPYSTTVAVLEQGLKVFVGIYKRLYRALGKEYKKIFRLNYVFLDEQKYFNLLDTGEEQQVGRQDFNPKEYDVSPNSDPNIVSEAQKMMKAQSLLQKMQMGMPLNPVLVTRQVLEAEGHEDIEMLMQAPPPQPDFETQLKMDELQHRKQMEQMEFQLKVANTQYEAMKDYAQSLAHLAKAAATEAGIERDDIKAMVDAIMAQESAVTQRISAIGQLQAKQEQQKKESESNGDSE